MRNGILHEAETRKWIIWRDVPSEIVKPLDDGFVLNRTLFYEAVKQEFESYLRDLREPTGNSRVKIQEKMNNICEES